MKKLGTYTYKHFAGMVQHRSGRMNPSFELLTVRVEVVEETQRKYRVKYLGFHASGAAVNSLHWVGQEKVALDDEVAAVPTPKPVPDTYRSPYKD